MLVTLPVLVHKALWNEIGDELNHLNASVRVFNPLVEDNAHVSGQLDVQVYIFSVISFAIHLPKETRHRREVSQNKGWQSGKVQRDSLCFQSRQLYYFILKRLYIVKKLRPLIPLGIVLVSVVQNDEHTSSKCEK